MFEEKRPARSGRNGQPRNHFPGSIVPPGTSLTARRSPESLHRIGEFLSGVVRPSSKTPGSDASIHLQFGENFCYPAKNIAEAGKTSRCGFRESQPAGVAARSGAKGFGLK